VVDALSRATHSTEVMALTMTIPKWIEQVTQSYEHDTRCSNLISKLIVDPQVVQHYTFYNGLLRYKGKLVFGNSGNLRQHLFTNFHDSSLGGHRRSNTFKI
jgi:hypothetical protein